MEIAGALFGMLTIVSDWGFEEDKNVFGF